MKFSKTCEKMKNVQKFKKKVIFNWEILLSLKKWIIYQTIQFWYINETFNKLWKKR